MRKSIKSCKMLGAYSCLLFILGAFAATDNIIPSQSIRDGETLVSVGGNFELGFFSPGTSAKRYLGIWYKTVSPRTVAWVANRETPLTDNSGLLNVTSKGIVLLDGKDRIFWSSNTSKTMKNPVLHLMDSGNLVLTDGNNNGLENLLWQSFDYPSDTLLPGMKLGRNFKTGMDRHLSSWKGIDDPAPGEFSLWIDTHGFPQLVLRKGSALQYRAGSWNGLGFTGTPPLKENAPLCDYKFVINENEVFYECDAKSALVSRLWVNRTGHILRSIRSPARQDGWFHAYYAPLDRCDLYSVCGANARCTTNSSRPCACLDGFVPKSPNDWSMSNWSKGCVRERELNCSNGDEFPKYVKLKLPDTSSSWPNTTMNLKECSELCSKNCSCTAYANSDVERGGSGCLLWFGDLMDMKEYNDGGQDLYIRIASKPGRSVPKRKVGIIIASVVLMAMFIVASLFCIWRKKLKKQGLTKMSHMKEDMELWEFDFASITKATDNFASYNKLGEGGFGPVYKGKLVEGQEIAIKRLSKGSGQGMEEFKNEITLIARLQHRNLVKLLGCCIQADESMLIYEYMPNKSLDFFIFDQARAKFLDWQKCIHIVGGIARGILYLHQDSRMRIIHRDLKASNVLLDNDMNPKISEFGMARIFGGDEIQTNTHKVVGTYGYMSPEYAAEGLFSVKTDVFSFGVLVLEIVGGKKNWRFSHPDHDHNLLGHAWILWKEKRAMELAGDTLHDSDPPPEVLRCIHVGLLCVQHRPEDRPNMSSVVLMLSSDSLLPEPNRPGFFTERSLPEAEFLPSYQQSSTTNEITITELQGR